MAMEKSAKILLTMLMLIALASCASLRGAPSPTWQIPEGIKTVGVNGYPMAYQETGSGIPVVFLHPSVDDYRAWSAQVPEFSKTYRVIAVSLRHYYPEKWNGIGDDSSIEQHASDVAALIKKLKLGKVHLIGNSLGGTVALNVANLQPDAIRSLILVAGNMESLMPETPEKQKRMADGKARGNTVRASYASGGPEKAAQAWLASYGVAWEKIPDKRKQVILDNIGTATESGDRGKLTCDDIQKFNFPILLMDGKKDGKLYGDMMTAIRQCKPDIPVPVIVPNGGHYPQREDPEFFNKVVLDFLKQH
jgi:esterase